MLRVLYASSLSILTIAVSFIGVSNEAKISDLDWFAAKFISSNMSEAQIIDCTALTQASYNFYRRLEREGEVSKEAILRVESREHNFWVQAYKIKTGKSLAYEDIVDLSQYRDQFSLIDGKERSHPQSVGSAVMSCQAAIKNANMSTHEKLGIEIIDERERSK
jgi:hypothetical protein